MTTVTRVLVVDDSAFVRKVVREMLSRSPYIEVVGAARDGEEALEMTETLKPDVVTCDLVMPRLDGVGFVREQMKRRPLPIIILSVIASNGDRALEALQAGALDFVQKPTSLANEVILKIRDELTEKVKGAAGAPAARLVAADIPFPSPIVPVNGRTLRVGAVVLGISTGGPQALRYMLPQFPADFPVPLCIVLHMPVGYTYLFAEKLNELSKIEVKEAAEGDVLRPGQALLAKAGRHLVLRRGTGGAVTAQLAINPTESLHRPSADVLFHSAAEVYNKRVLGVVMTGMGDDGKQGSAWIKAQGGTILTEAAESCVIYGMPRSVTEAGLSDACVPLERMAQAIMENL
ncbi:MAG TPA: chemotaxis response regulator protein-glutamate methylesterase [Candidatus Saccharimonadales bacterium]|nr:chemotaxis response regulator protein-glutamate methylesterase [Candidatus Saccharimonadales bacterium]